MFRSCAAVALTAALLVAPEPTSATQTSPAALPAATSAPPAATPAALTRLAAAVSVDPGAVPNRTLDATIHRDQLELVTAAADRVVAGDEETLNAEASTVRADQAALAGNRQALAAADAELASDDRATVSSEQALAAAKARRARDAATVASDVRQLRAVAVGWYVGEAAQPLSDAVGDLGGAQAAADDHAELEIITAELEGVHRRDVAAASSASTHEKASAATLRRDEAVEATTRTEGAERATQLATTASALEQTRAVLSAARAALAAARSARVAAIRDLDGPEAPSTDPVPTILGPSALTGQQLAAWFDWSGYVDATSVPIQQLATWYVDEGEAEGVRGDIAFAQAVVETGGFDSPDAVERNNYAGIGHCDSCRAGLRFSSPLQGVRGQIQLLRTYADPGLTASQLAGGLALPSLDPALQTARGCCSTWSSLTGVWATDPEYGLTILELYQGMLSYTIAAEGSP